MTKQIVFLIKADNGKEAVMRLPVDRYQGITAKGHQIIRQRFYDGSAKVYHGLKYALNLEAFTNGEDLMQALSNYQKSII
jgi:hypothetical protein